VELTPHPARVPMKRIGIAGHPLPSGEGKTRLRGWRIYEEQCTGHPCAV
jgi:hypothetical protein